MVTTGDRRGLGVLQSQLCRLQTHKKLLLSHKLGEGVQSPFLCSQEALTSKVLSQIPRFIC